MGRIILTSSSQGIFINTISGGIVNFGGALKIAPISITSSSAESGQSNKGLDVTENPGTLLTLLGSEAIVKQNSNTQG
jgi:hypothetical protein